MENNNLNKNYNEINKKTKKNIFTNFKKKKKKVETEETNVPLNKTALKTINILKLELIISMAIQAISIIVLLLLKLFTIYDVFYITIFISTIISFMGVKKKKTYVGKTGLIIAIMLMLTILLDNVINLILGILVLIHSIKYIKEIKTKHCLKKDIKMILITIGLVLLTILGIVLYQIDNAKLECTRENGDNVVIRFNKKGISKLYINDERKQGLTYLNYVANFVIPFLKNDDEKTIDKIESYKEIVKKHEEEKGSVCK